MTLMSSISALTSSVDQLTAEVNVSKATLDAKVAQAAAEVVSAQAEQALAEGYRDTTATHAADAATHLATVKAGVTYQGISAILAEKAVTAVDVFVYDTSLDSDGGAWRKRCQHTSWYNEALNTSTRGSRREFPAVAVIVAEAGKVTIYDGDDPALPMWMVFEPFEGTNAAQVIFRAGGSGAHKSLAAINGVLTAGMTQTANYAGGLRYVRFIADDAYYHDESSAATDGRFNGNIARRNEPLGFSKVSNWPLIVNRRCNDVAMTVLPDAPIDPATGLPVPTIAVATDGGVSVIKDDGTVQNFSGEAHFGVTFSPDGTLLVQDSVFNKNYQFLVPTDSGFVSVGNIGNILTPNQSRANSGRGVFIDNTTVAFGGGSTVGINSIPCLQTYKLDFSAGRSAYMNAITTSNYNTGWLNGDIKGAFLSDTADTDLVEATLLEDDFLGYADDADLQATWTLRNPTDTLLTLSNGAARIENNVAIAEWVSRQFNTVAGKTYYVTGQRVGAGAGVVPRLLVGLGNYNGSLLQLQFNADGVLSGCFMAKGTTTYLTLATNNGNVGAFAIFDNISVKLADEDRSVNNNGLIVNGTITRSPVADGAEMVGYAGGGSNYLSRDFAGAYTGHSSFTLIGWYFGGTAGFWDWYEAVGGGSSVAFLDTYMDAMTKSFRLVWQNRTSIILQGDGPSIEGRWAQIALCFTGSGGLHFYQDGRLIKAYTNVPSATLHELRVWPGGGSRMALLRLSETTLTPAQIAKIYEDERKLFMPGAACTLFGTSDAVTALAHDPKTNLLHVGTSVGRSTFDGLVRVANTETPVGTAISAVNDLIAEQ